MLICCGHAVFFKGFSYSKIILNLGLEIISVTLCQVTEVLRRTHCCINSTGRLFFFTVSVIINTPIHRLTLTVETLKGWERMQIWGEHANSTQKDRDPKSNRGP